MNVRKSIRQQEAKERLEAYSKLTLQQKIDRLPPEPFAAKQRARLLALQVVQNKPAAVKEQAVVDTIKDGKPTLKRQATRITK